MFIHGQISANRMKLGPSFQLYRSPFACCRFMVLLSQTA